MALPRQLRDRPAHRIADRDEGVDAQRVGHAHGVVGAVLEPERAARSQPAAVTALVERHDAPTFGQRRVAREEVEVGGGGPTVQEDQRRRARRAGGVAHEQRPEAGQFDVAARGQLDRGRGWCVAGERLRVARSGLLRQTGSTLSTVTLSAPLGAW